MIGAETLGKTQTQTQTRGLRAGHKNRDSRTKIKTKTKKLGQGRIRGEWSKVKPEFRVLISSSSSHLFIHFISSSLTK